MLDPLVRMKGVGRKENDQDAMDLVIEFLRKLREETEATVCFVHHTGHSGEHMRGTSKLESFWETRLRWKRDGQSPVVDVESEHREAEAGPIVRYRIGWDAETRSMRFDADAEPVPTLAERILEHLLEHGAGSTDTVRKGVGVRRSDVLRTLEELETAGTVHRGPSGRRDKAGRPIRDKVWNLSNQAGLWPVPDTGRTTDEKGSGHRGPSHRPRSLDLGGTDEPPDGPRSPGEPGYAMQIDAAYTAGHILEHELRSLLRVDAFIAQRAAHEPFSKRSDAS